MDVFGFCFDAKFPELKKTTPVHRVPRLEDFHASQPCLLILHPDDLGKLSRFLDTASRQPSMRVLIVSGAPESVMPLLAGNATAHCLSEVLPGEVGNPHILRRLEAFIADVAQRADWPEQPEAMAALWAQVDPEAEAAHELLSVYLLLIAEAKGVNVPVDQGLWERARRQFDTLRTKYAPNLHSDHISTRGIAGIEGLRRLFAEIEKQRGS